MPAGWLIAGRCPEAPAPAEPVSAASSDSATAAVILLAIAAVALYAKFLAGKKRPAPPELKPLFAEKKRKKWKKRK